MRNMPFIRETCVPNRLDHRTRRGVTSKVLKVQILTDTAGRASPAKRALDVAPDTGGRRRGWATLFVLLRGIGTITEQS
jgi:hypothetical protein